ncbi:unnamed protein product [Rangifer tarandus platyrhynchus]|uniref:Uncharacterized protein n=1 Tax=Rangifer tarandus platyrhynchus TaxID=3082113 RepID=A0AC59ZHH0_RANTA
MEAPRPNRGSAPPQPWKRPAPSLVLSPFRESPPTTAPSLTWPLPSLASPPRARLQPPQRSPVATADSLEAGVGVGSTSCG